ncbi:outer membrane protein assembly factor BamD [candidate division KSB1 bacterium]|nr:outer membrane protein assembly factor BamD [candidate division KSB1 bacterium]
MLSLGLLLAAFDFLSPSALLAQEDFPLPGGGQERNQRPPKQPKERKRKSGTVLPADEAWSRAMDLFRRERYYRAQQILRDITLNYSGSAFIDSAQFYLARTSFEQDDYIIAADEFHRLITQYPFSKLVGDAAYWEGRCYYEQAPSYALDQEYTTKAFDTFQRFLEDNAGHALTDSAYRYITFCREQLAHKEFAAAELYFRLQEYASAALYADIVLSDYYDTSWAESAQYLKARCFASLKDWPRARDESKAYLDRYPTGGRREAARLLYAHALRKAEPMPLNNATTP